MHCTMCKLFALFFMMTIVSDSSTDATGNYTQSRDFIASTISAMRNASAVHDVVFVLDRSRGVSYTSFYAEQKNLMLTLVEHYLSRGSQLSRAGVVTFSASASVDLNMTATTSSESTFMDSVRDSERICYTHGEASATNITSALSLARAMLFSTDDSGNPEPPDRTNVTNLIILMSDFEFKNAELDNGVSRMLREGVQLLVVGVGAQLNIPSLYTFLKLYISSTDTFVDDTGVDVRHRYAHFTEWTRIVNQEPHSTDDVARWRSLVNGTCSTSDVRQERTKALVDPITTIQCNASHYNPIPIINATGHIECCEELMFVDPNSTEAMPYGTYCYWPARRLKVQYNIHRAQCTGGYPMCRPGDPHTTPHTTEVVTGDEGGDEGGMMVMMAVSIAAALGGAAVLVGVILLYYCCCRKSRGSQDPRDSNQFDLEVLDDDRSPLAPEFYLDVDDDTGHYANVRDEQYYVNELPQHQRMPHWVTAMMNVGHFGLHQLLVGRMDGNKFISCGFHARFKDITKDTQTLYATVSPETTVPLKISLLGEPYDVLKKDTAMCSMVATSSNRDSNNNNTMVYIRRTKIYVVAGTTLVGTQNHLQERCVIEVDKLVKHIKKQGL